MEEMAEPVARHKDDCEQMGQQLNDFFDRNQARIARMKAIGNGDVDPKAAEAAQAKYMDRMTAAMQRLMPGQLACQDSLAVQAAMKKF